MGTGCQEFEDGVEIRFKCWCVCLCVSLRVRRYSSCLGFEDTCYWVVCTWFGIGPYAECEDFVNPFFWVSFIVVFTRDWLASGESIGTKVVFCWDMYEFEVKEFDSGDPSIHCSVWLDIWVV